MAEGTLASESTLSDRSELGNTAEHVEQIPRRCELDYDSSACDQDDPDGVDQRRDDGERVVEERSKEKVGSDGVEVTAKPVDQASTEPSRSE